MHRILTIDSLEDARHELTKIQVSSQGVVVMAPKAIGTAIKLTGVRLGAANILKQEMLSIGGDAAVARGVVDGKATVSDVILLGNADKIRKLIDKLKYQTIFGLPQIAGFLGKALGQLTQAVSPTLNCNGILVDLSKTGVMGICNVTPDSFSDGGVYLDPDRAASHGVQMLDDGALIVDIGGESTRPGSGEVDADTELSRVIPVIERLRRLRPDSLISLDTRKAAVAEAGLGAGASIVNDISALRDDPAMVDLLSGTPEIPVILMHMLGTPKTMQQQPVYADVVDDILNFFDERLSFCINNGIAEERLLIDPGIGFGKRLEDNLLIMKKIAEFHTFGRPVVLGASRKSFIDKLTPTPVEDRLPGTLAAGLLAAHERVALLRVHDVAEHVKALTVLQAMRDSQ